MKNTFGVKLIYQFYHSSVKAELKRRGLSSFHPAMFDNVIFVTSCNK